MVKLKHLILIIESLIHPEKFWSLRTLSTCVAMLLIGPAFMQAQIEETVTTRNFEPANGNQLIIRFSVPDSGNEFTYNLHTAYMFSANGSKITIESFSGSQLKLAEGESYEIVWDVLRDTDELEEPESVEINLEYTPASRIKASELENGSPTQYKTQTDQRVIFDSQPEYRQEEQEEKVEAPEYHNQQTYHYNHRRRPALRLGLLGHAGYVKADLNKGYEEIKYDFGYGYGLGAFLEIHMGGSTYLQLEGAYAVRTFEFNNFGFYKAPDGCEYLYNTEDAKISFTDYRVAARLKLGILQLGAYYSFLQEAKRSGDMNYRVSCQDGTFQEIHIENLEYNFLNGEDFPIDSNGERAVNADYGLSVGIETVPRNNFILGIGVDYSLSNLINNNYKGWDNQDSRDLFPTQTIDLKLAYAYIRLGFRI